MDGQKRTIRRELKTFFPARANGQVVCVEPHRAETEKNPCGKFQAFTAHAQVDKIAEVEGEKPDADEKSREKAQTAKDDFFHHRSGNQENFGPNQPQDRDEGRLHMPRSRRRIGWPRASSIRSSRPSAVRTGAGS